MRTWLAVGILLLACGQAGAEMVRGDTIGNDPTKEALCKSRSTVGHTFVPFEIDAGYVAAARQQHPDATFVAVDGISPQLLECYLRGGDGKYGPVSFSPEQGYWHLIKPQQFKPGLNSGQGRTIAANACLAVVKPKINRSNFDHIVYSMVVEIDKNGPKYHAGAIIAGKKAERYDIAVKGTSFYKSSGPDLDGVNFTCLLSPMLDVKGIELN